ncbi:hypothetical protein EZS27_013378 [termite gut metagenome]|uniref:Uncharacterized protein n=1 Tax=termite gut metagenome TaxID=433724 RepID=A0A5J4RZG3_9ZZZZ
MKKLNLITSQIETEVPVLEINIELLKRIDDRAKKKQINFINDFFDKKIYVNDKYRIFKRTLTACLNKKDASLIIKFINSNDSKCEVKFISENTILEKMFKSFFYYDFESKENHYINEIDKKGINEDDYNNKNDNNKFDFYNLKFFDFINSFISEYLMDIKEFFKKYKSKKNVGQNMLTDFHLAFDNDKYIRQEYIFLE